MPNGINRVAISEIQAQTLIDLAEGQFGDVKGRQVTALNLSKALSAFANADGGDLYIGITELQTVPQIMREWDGFADEEAANAHIQVFEKFFPLGTDFQYEFLSCPSLSGWVLHVQVNKTQAVMRAANNIRYVRRGAQSLPVESPEAIRRLEYAKGIASFEIELTNAPLDLVVESPVIKFFVEHVVPTATPERWLRKNVLLRDDRPTVAGVLLFAEEPQALIPKHCGIKVYRYKTSAAEGSRDTLAGDPLTVEGDLYSQISSAVTETKSIIEGIQKMGEGGLEPVTYPPDTLHEIITNAVLHRDYEIADDVHIRIFDNRIEVQSPGRLPAHITVRNILNERFARNGTVVRILNKFPNPPNKDVGEGLNTAFEAMTNLGLKPPVISELENNVLVVIRHESLASPEEAIMDYLTNHETIRNRDARAICHIPEDHKIKTIFRKMEKAGMIEQVPGTDRATTVYRVPVKEEPPGDDGVQQELNLGLSKDG